MNKNIYFAVISLIFLSFQTYSGKYNHVINIGDSLPSFKNLPSTDGTTLSSDEIKEDIVIMVMLANHCPWVKGMDQDLIKLVDSFKGQSIKVVGFGVNLREDDRLDAMKVHAKKVGYNFTYLFDETQQLGRDLGSTKTPEYFVFDSNRKLAYMGLLYNSPAKMNKDGSIKHINGKPTEFYVTHAVEELLAGKPISNAETRAHGCSVKYE